MTALQYARNDLKGIVANTGKIEQRHIDQVSGVIDEARSPEQIGEKVFGEVRQQFIWLTIANAIADSKGRARGGHPTLADEIMDRQYHKIKKYSSKAYPLSDKQVLVILQGVWQWKDF